jgi:hypothetical protein
MMTRPYIVTEGGRRVPLAGPPRRPRFRVLRGALAAAALLLSAAETLLSAVTGWRRPSRVARELAAAYRDAWRRGAPRPSPIPPPSVVSVTTIKEEDTTDGRP